MQLIRQFAEPATQRLELAVQGYVRVKLFTRLRRGDLLRLRLGQDFRDDGIHVQPHKTSGMTQKRLIIEYSADLRTAVDLARAARRVDIAPFLFCTRRGECYMKEDGSANGWDSSSAALTVKRCAQRGTFLMCR